MRWIGFASTFVGAFVVAASIALPVVLDELIVGDLSNVLEPAAARSPPRHAGLRRHAGRLPALLDERAAGAHLVARARQPPRRACWPSRRSPPSRSAPGSPATCTTSSRTRSPSWSRRPTAPGTSRRRIRRRPRRRWSRSRRPRARRSPTCGCCSPSCATRRATARSATLVDLERLFEQLRAAGLTIADEVSGEPLPLGTAQQLAVYRIVQESLTNALRHADVREPSSSTSAGRRTASTSRSRARSSRRPGAPGRSRPARHPAATASRA